MIVRVAVLGMVLVTALLLTTVVAPAFALGGVRPDLVLLTVVGVALVDGAGAGARYGFTAGLISDLLSGSSQLVGLGAFVLLLAGYLTGLSRPYIGGSAVLGQVAITAAATVAVVLGYGLLATLLDVPAPGLSSLVGGAIGLALYHAMLVPVVVRPVGRLSRRFSGDAAGSGGSALAGSAPGPFGR